MTVKNIGDDEKAMTLIQKQLVDGQKMLNADRKDKRPRVSPSAHSYAVKLFEANQLGKGPRPKSVTDRYIIDELIESGVLIQEGLRRGTTYTLQFRPADIFIDASKSAQLTAKRRRKTVKATSGVTSKSVITIGASERDTLRKSIHEYLAFATSLEARKHEQKRQSDSILDHLNIRAKEILRASKREEGCRLTPLDAMRHAQAEIAMDFEALLQLRFDPLFFAIFGITDTADTSMQTMRS